MAFVPLGNKQTMSWSVPYSLSSFSAKSQSLLYFFSDLRQGISIERSILGFLVNEHLVNDDCGDRRRSSSGKDSRF
jgi:hypothetical protein